MSRDLGNEDFQVFMNVRQGGMVPLLLKRMRFLLFFLIGLGIMTVFLII